MNVPFEVSGSMLVASVLWLLFLSIVQQRRLRKLEVNNARHELSLFIHNLSIDTVCKELQELKKVKTDASP